MKSKRLLSIIFIFVIALSFPSSQIFAQNVTNKDEIFIMRDYVEEHEHTNDVHEENAGIITCCDRISWRRYKLETHSRTSPTCYADVYDFYICDNCNASYKEYKESYEHPRVNCPY